MMGTSDVFLADLAKRFAFVSMLDHTSGDSDLAPLPIFTPRETARALPSGIRNGWQLRSPWWRPRLANPAGK